MLLRLDLIAVDLSQALSIDEVVHRIGERIARTPPGQWVVTSARWHESRLVEQRFPRRDELDRAYSAFQEDRIDSITAGKLADLVVLEADPCRVEPEAIRDIRVLETPGQWAHRLRGI